MLKIVEIEVQLLSSDAALAKKRRFLMWFNRSNATNGGIGSIPVADICSFGARLEYFFAGAKCYGSHTILEKND